MTREISPPPFSEQMKHWYSEIDRLVLAAECACKSLKDGKCTLPPSDQICPFLQTWRADRGCKLPVFRMQLGGPRPHGKEQGK